MGWNLFGRVKSKELPWPTEAELKVAHDGATNNQDEILRSESCGCFYCLDTYPPNRIEDWTDEGRTAICPCGVDSVVGSASGRVDPLFLKSMRAYWFRIDNRPWPKKMDEATLAALLDETGYPPNPVCPACGFRLDFPPWNGDSSSDEMCPCCWIQFGYDDASPAGRDEAYVRWREAWKVAGMPWRGKGRGAPEHWDPAVQVRVVEGWKKTEK